MIKATTNGLIRFPKNFNINTDPTMRIVHKVTLASLIRPSDSSLLFLNAMVNKIEFLNMILNNPKINVLAPKFGRQKENLG